MMKQLNNDLIHIVSKYEADKDSPIDEDEAMFGDEHNFVKPS